MGQSSVQNTSRAPLVAIAQAKASHEFDNRPIQEVIARRVSQRARRRLFVAMIPLLFLLGLLAYVLATYGA